MEMGPLGVFTSFSDGWLVSRQAKREFATSALLTVALTTLLLSRIDIQKLNLGARIAVGVLGIVGLLAALFLFAAMCRYWYQLDDSGRCAKGLSLALLGLGFPWGSCVYLLFVYLRQTTGHRSYALK
jgi:hypothetical protein